jgi:hypothetical protein
MVLGRQGRTAWARCSDCGSLIALTEEDWQEFLRDEEDEEGAEEDEEDKEGADCVDGPPADN